MALSTFYHSTLDFFRDIDDSDFIEIMTAGANDSLIYPTDSEVVSWKNNRDALLVLFNKANLPGDVEIAFELQMPISGGRIDCVLCGKASDGKNNMVHIELKQWSNENVSTYYDKYTFSVLVDGYKNGSVYVSHPSQQVSGYQNCLLNYVEAFEKSNINLYDFAYCYNYDSKKIPNELLAVVYEEIIGKNPLYCGDQITEFSCVLNVLLCGGNGEPIFNEIVNSNIGQTQRLYDVAAHMLDNNKNDKVFELVSDQINAYNAILGAANSTPKDEKTVVIVKGGPGTGKSVIAIRLLAELYAQGFKNVYYATRSSSLRNGWKQVLTNIGNYGSGSACDLIKSTYDFRPYFYGFKENGGDVLIVDEAHRIHEKSGDQTDSYRPKECTSNLSQIMAMLYTSRVSVFFIDDRQSINNGEIGLSSEIKKAAEEYTSRINEENDRFINYEIPLLEKSVHSEEIKLEANLNKGASEKVINACEKKIRSLNKRLNLQIVEPKVQKVNVIELELKDQFRCNGSNNFLGWVDNMIYEDGRIPLDTSSYEFEVFDTPQKMVEKIRSLDEYAMFVDTQKKIMGDDFSYEKIQKEIAGKQMSFATSARVVAGWCWKWNDKVIQQNGDLLHEVKIPEFDFDMPWETKAAPNNDFRFKYAKDADSWCNQNEGVNQVGCIHSIQGWETDYVGVIIGPDITYDENRGFVYVPQLQSEDGHRELGSTASNKNDQLIKNIYRVLLTRGKKGCFVFATDPKVRSYIKKCVKGNK